MNAHRRTTATTLFLLAGCLGLALAAAPAQAEKKGKGKSKVETTKALKQAGWGDNVRVRFDRDAHTIRYRSDGLPNHSLLPEYAVPNPGVVVPNESNSHIESSADAIKKVPYDFTLTTKPRKAKEKTVIETGPVGLMISGAMTYNPFEGDGETVAAASNFTLTNAQGEEVPFVDGCFGHPAPRPLSAYHYHALSKCLTRQVDRRGKASHIQGIAFDGFPIYGNRDIDGKKVKPKDLDGCNGIRSPTPEFPDGIYHYVMLGVPTKQSSLRCLKGKVPAELEAILEGRRYRCTLLGTSRRVSAE